jgi:hypothetical protein
MLLIDELAYWATKKYGMTPTCTMRLDDLVNLDYPTGPTPFALYGRSVFSGVRNSRFLQSVRGYGYYETFGFWPAGLEPAVYMQRMAHVKGRLGIAPKDDDYADTAGAALKGRQIFDMHKTFPPVLPPLADGAVRVFADMDDFYHRVLLVGSYGQAAGIARPVRPASVRPGPARPQKVSPVELPATDAAALIDAVRQSSPCRLPACNVDGVPAPRGVEAYWLDNDTGGFTVGEWTILLAPGEVEILGPLTHVPQVSRLAESLAAEFAPGARISWHFVRHHRELVYVRGKIQETGDGLFLARGTEMLTALGYLPSPDLQDAAGLLQQARAADAQFGGTFVESSHPRFPQLARIARALVNDKWIRPARPHGIPPTKRVREERPPEPQL